MFDRNDAKSVLTNGLIRCAICILVVTSLANAQDTLFKSDSYYVTGEKVVQGKYSASAISPLRIESTYQSDYRIFVPNRIEIKFSINGFDDEAPTGQNHILVLNPKNGKCASPLFVFGDFAGENDSANAERSAGYLTEDASVKIRVDMRPIMRQLKEHGFYETATGQKIFAADFKGLYIAGNAPPLNWNFQELAKLPQFALSDSDSDGVYETTILFRKEVFPGRSAADTNEWELKSDISAFPQYQSGSVLSEALYNKSLEEMEEDIRQDGSFMAGAMWPGVWTRDVSYSSILSLAIVNPDAVKKSLLAKVKNDRIIQDTGTGGSWPVSSDRTVWALAAWEVYKVTGDRDWLASAYEIIRNSTDDDLHTIVDSETGLFHGESSFLDWREQTYPGWMDPKDIYQSENLGTNAVQYETYRVLASMASALGKSPTTYLQIAGKIKAGINKYLWLPKQGYYGQYLYGRNFPSVSIRAEALGEALCVIFHVAGNSRASDVVEKTPVTRYGITCIYPQTPDTPPYHNDAIWPFVESYWAWASAETHDLKSVSCAIASVYRAAAFFLTNKENMVASTGDFMGTQINSSRQLWSVAGNLAIVYRVLFGMEFYSDSLQFAPCVPASFAGDKVLTNLKYRNSNLTITVRGTGDVVDYIALDGVRIEGRSIPSNLQGNHSVFIKIRNGANSFSKTNMVEDVFAPGTPNVRAGAATISWSEVKGADQYRIYRNAQLLATVRDTVYPIKGNFGYSEYQVQAVAAQGTESFLSEPLVWHSTSQEIFVEGEEVVATADHDHQGFTGTGYVLLSDSMRDSLTYSVNCPATGLYAIDFRYANGNGPINTDNKCAIRSLRIDGKIAGVVVMPQRGDGIWQSWGYSNPIHVRISKGKHVLAIYFDKHDNNMNGKVNSALLDSFRMIMISH